MDSYRQKMLAHCLWIAEQDSTYASWAAGWYEENEPEILRNLKAKVDQEIFRREQNEKAKKESRHDTDRGNRNSLRAATR